MLLLSDFRYCKESPEINYNLVWQFGWKEYSAAVALAINSGQTRDLSKEPLCDPVEMAIFHMEFFPKLKSPLY